MMQMQMKIQKEINKFFNLTKRNIAQLVQYKAYFLKSKNVQDANLVHIIVDTLLEGINEIRNTINYINITEAEKAPNEVVLKAYSYIKMLYNYSKGKKSYFEAVKQGMLEKERQRKKIAQDILKGE